MRTLRIVTFLGVAALLVAAAFYGVAHFSTISYHSGDAIARTVDSVADVVAATSSPEEIEAPPVPPTATHLPTPEPLKAIYMTQCVVGTPSFRAKLVSLIDETELNAVVIDIKDFSGYIGFPSEHPLLKEAVMGRCGAYDMREFVAMLHEKGVYVIGRITVFQDPYYSDAHPELAIKKGTSTSTVWRDNKGLAFIDVGAKPFWDYIVTLSKESYALGFDELNFDYVRYPSDGPISDSYFPWSEGKDKSVALEEFFAYLDDALSDIDVVTSADIFGMTTVMYHDLNIGQILEKALAHFDYVAPMVYPSHYPRNFNGWPNPNDFPYEIIKFSMDTAVERAEATASKIQIAGAAPIMKTVTEWSEATGTTTRQIPTGLYEKPAYDRLKLRTWIQDFDYGGDYDAATVRSEIQATYDSGLTSWMIWDPGNTYTKEALLPFWKVPAATPSTQ